jgi:hypothetical protein
MQTVAFMTAGDGYWSNISKAVEITDMQLGYVNDDQDFGELRVYFNTATWDVEHDGLIYTDSDFLNELQLFLGQNELAGFDVNYSEQGMQGDDYVSLDVGKPFLAAWALKFGVDSLVV